MKIVSTVGISLVLLVLCITRVHAAADPISPGSWTLAVLPDTQHYVDDPANAPIFTTQTQWIKDHKATHNIQYVLHLGDVTQNNNTTEWNRAKTSLNVLNGQVPYAIAPGNHDYTVSGNSRSSLFNSNTYYGPTSAYGTQSSVGGFFEAGKTDNSFHKFTINNQPWMVVALEFGPRNEVVTWADSIVAANPNHNTILITHAYMNNDSTRYDWATKGASQNHNPHSYNFASLPGGVNDGQELWDKLVSKHANFRLVLNGHVLGDGTGYLASTGINGNVVHQMLSNYQFLEDGGQGYMRFLEFNPLGNDALNVKVKTYSPSLDVHNRSTDQEFSFNITVIPEPSFYALAFVVLVAGAIIKLACRS
jgi:hypothetical protein